MKSRNPLLNSFIVLKGIPPLHSVTVGMTEKGLKPPLAFKENYHQRCDDENDAGKNPKTVRIVNEWHSCGAGCE